MKTPRLLPVVIAAASALLLLKGIGLMTTGSYVLTGSGAAIAASGRDHGGGASGAAEATVDPSMGLPADATMTDTSPTLDDGAPVLPLGPADAPAAGSYAEEDSPTEAVDEAAKVDQVEAAIEAVCPPDVPVEGSQPTEAAAVECPPSVARNEYGDALPMELNSAGVLAPMEVAGSSETDLLGRLGERRDTLDAREEELDMRMALVEAAEKRLDERTATLKAIEAKINALVDEKKSAEKAQFTGIVAMYETMKAKEAATIFNQLDIPVLLRVARAMNPRKMAPILARMDPLKAKQLTAGLTAEEAEPALDVAVEDLNNLPQIVGQ